MDQADDVRAVEFGEGVFDAPSSGFSGVAASPKCGSELPADLEIEPPFWIKGSNAADELACCALHHCELPKSPNVPMSHCAVKLCQEAKRDIGWPLAVRYRQTSASAYIAAYASKSSGIHARSVRRSVLSVVTL